jgi:hypothetical protein
MYTLHVGYRKAIGRLAHDLVATEFIGPRPKNIQVNHKDGNKLNNHLSNLEYVTCLQNIRHAINVLKIDWGSQRRGSMNGRAKLTEDDVREIRKRHTWFDESALAREFGVAHCSINRITKRQTWKHID